jgi:hypothetical protein
LGTKDYEIWVSSVFFHPWQQTVSEEDERRWWGCEFKWLFCLLQLSQVKTWFSLRQFIFLETPSRITSRVPHRTIQNMVHKLQKLKTHTVEYFVRFKNVVPHRRHITSPLQSPAS